MAKKITKKKITKKKIIRKKAATRRRARATVPDHIEEEGEPDPVEEMIQEARQEVMEEAGWEPHAYDMAGNAERGRERIHDICDQMGTMWGTHTAMPMSMATVVNIKRMPIGIIEFDYRTGGGIVIGRNNRLQGTKDTLKSTTCLKALAAAQRTCRECKWPIVQDPESGRVNCHCPEHRFWVNVESDYMWLPQHAALSLHGGHLPDGWEYQNVTGMGRVPVLVCSPPPHMKGKKGVKRRPIPFAEGYRCEPMRTCLYDTEFTTDRLWAEANGVDPSLVGYTNAKWAEQGLESVERMILTHEFDLVIIDSTSMMETREHLEDRKIGERGTPAGKQKLMGDFMKRIVAAQVEGGVAGRYSPTLLTTSHLTTKGMGYGQHAHLGPTDGLTASHGIAMDIKLRAERFVMDKDKQRSIYGVFEFTIAKNHCGGMGSTKTKGQIKYWLMNTPDHPVGDSNDLATVMDHSRRFGDGFISEGTGKAKVILHSQMISGGRKPFRTLRDTTAYLREHGGVFQELRQRVLEKLIEDRSMLMVTETEEPTDARARPGAANAALAERPAQAHPSSWVRGSGGTQCGRARWRTHARERVQSAPLAEGRQRQRLLQGVGQDHGEGRRQVHPSQERDWLREIDAQARATGHRPMLTFGFSADSNYPEREDWVGFPLPLAKHLMRTAILLLEGNAEEATAHAELALGGSK